ncbi:XRE family transcriptional regulator [Streptomyces marispadix]|uniref:XRE family transcriptional regulator n=1 Tax=Streptomyces marispadix TaxID=2922868 RepID=A0ABS9T3M5_9ACTN|nr:XRE family transcriptional regulator [Streptomyces marispadix]MCH6163134.1 XRE family transcriptional regulator [Streptomyces marispadix]
MAKRAHPVFTHHDELITSLLSVLVVSPYGEHMARTRNRALAAWMSEHEVTAQGLSDLVNDALRELTGRDGKTSERTVFRWLSGENQWPQAAQRAALQSVTGCPATDLGFVPRCRAPASPAQQEDPVHRRSFITATTGATAAATPLVAARPFAVGTTDVMRLRAGLDDLTVLDASKGGHEALERAALKGASSAMEKQHKAASQRIRKRLFSVAAEYTTAAAWSAVDARQLERAREHLNRALYMARLARDSIAELDVWNVFAMLARQQQRHTEAVDSGRAAQATAVARRDPLFASLAHARTAIGHANCEERQAALLSLGHAKEALNKAVKGAPRPSWIAFYGRAELLAISAIVHDRLGDPVHAEAASHQALAAIPRQFRRNRALATVQLALTQVHQRDVEQACETAGDVFALMEGDSIPGRMRSLLGDFQRDLIATAPKASATRDWIDRYRSEWSRKQ